MKFKLTWFLTAILILITAVGIVYISFVVNRQDSETESVSSEEWKQYCLIYGFAGGTPYTDLTRLCEKKNAGKAENPEIYYAVELLLPEDAQLLELSWTEQQYDIDYALPENDGVYTKIIHLVYCSDGTAEISVREKNQIITVNSDLVKKIQYVS